MGIHTDNGAVQIAENRGAAAQHTRSAPSLLSDCRDSPAASAGLERDCGQVTHPGDAPGLADHVFAAPPAATKGAPVLARAPKWRP
eukprot:CAMPEP_0202075678 /NCGR_PEP_ID=MMETSP0964-20121228/4354_1 /ASSEMBLY_ACC=CAM_ASM_000500 /TAXON_ID=4773 /ORGANISM="Schizochytrium aggregatum, Strain ATCC28209" /LENGTH=85 /DNA_ID=CAMNT_0048642881 /DNA_START=169 /DNA_END=427 /DNA_ORIENTATION=-